MTPRENRPSIIGEESAFFLLSVGAGWQNLKNKALEHTEQFFKKRKKDRQMPNKDIVQCFSEKEGWGGNGGQPKIKEGAK